MENDDGLQFEPSHSEMGRHAKSGILNSGFVQIVKVLGQFASVVILARLLKPDDFGLVAMTGPIIAFVQIFMDLGLNQAIIQKQKLSSKEVSVFFWINVSVGLALAGFIVSISPLVGLYYNDPRVVFLTIAMALPIAIGAVGAQHATILTRRMEFRTLAYVDLGSTLSSIIVPIFIAFVYPTYWALYFGQLASTLFSVVAVWTACHWRPLWVRIGDVRSVSDSVRFGLGITTFNLTNFFSRNLDNVLIGHAYGSVELGYYDRAYKFLLFPLQRVVFPVNNILVPILSRLQDKNEEYRAFYLKTNNLLLLVTWPWIAWSALFSNDLFGVLLGKDWGNSASVFQVLAVAAFIQMMNSLTGALFISQGRSRDYGAWGFVSSLTSVLSFIAGLRYGIFGVAAFYAAAEILRTPFLWYFVGKRGPVSFAALVGTIVPHLLAVGVTIAGVFAVVETIAMVPVIRLIVTGLLAYPLYAIGLLLHPEGRKLLKVVKEIVATPMARVGLLRRGGSTS